MATEQTRRQLRARLRWGIAGIVALFFIALAYDMPAKANKVIDRVNGMVALGIPHISVADFSLGLDLQGGAHLVYQADVTAIPDGDRATAVEGVRDVIERRVNGIGVGEPHVQTTKVGDEYRVIVELPGVTDINRAISMIGGTPILEFKEENDVPARDLTKDEQKQINDFNADAKKRADETLKRLKNGEVFSDIAKEVSEDPYSKNNGGYIGYISNTFDPTLYNWAQTAAQGDQSHVIENEAGYALLERAGERAGEPSIEASDIVICYLGSSDCDAPLYTKKEAKDKAQEIFDQANASNFDDLALQYSTSQKRTDSPEAMDALKKASAGEIIGPVEAGDGFHVLYKQSEQPTVEYEISLIFIKKQTILDILPPQDPWKPTGLSGKNLERAEVVSDTISGAVQVSLQFDSEGTDLFKSITERHIGEPVAIFLDGQPISTPIVQTAITNGRAVISGNFNLNDARLLSQRLNAGALPVPVELISQQSVGATLGASSLQKSLIAGLIGILIVMLFMTVLYRVPGLVSVFSLSLYAVLTLAVFKLIGVTLTLAGIGGFILSIGMAVDANVLIFERMKEELRQKKSLKAALEDGFVRAWSSIRDGNVSTLITCAMLIWFGSSFVQGFAVALALGILVSMFTAITITRVVLRFIIPWFPQMGNRAFWGFTE